MKKITSKKTYTLGCMFFLFLGFCYSQNKNNFSFGLRYNQTNVNNNLYNIQIFSTSFNPLGNGTQYLVNNIGSEIKYSRLFNLNKTINLNTGLVFQEERCDFVSRYVVFGKRHYRNLGLNIGIEKIKKINNEVSLGLCLGMLINRSLSGGGRNENNQNNSTTVGIIDRGSRNLSINSNGDTTENYSEYEKLYFKTSKIKLTPRIELNGYFKSGKNQIRLAAFFQWEARKHNFHEYTSGFNDILNNKKYDSEVYKTDPFRMKVFGFNLGYCF